MSAPHKSFVEHHIKASYHLHHNQFTNTRVSKIFIILHSHLLLSLGYIVSFYSLCHFSVSEMTMRMFLFSTVPYICSCKVMAITPSPTCGNERVLRPSQVRPFSHGHFPNDYAKGQRLMTPMGVWTIPDNWLPTHDLYAHLAGWEMSGHINFYLEYSATKAYSVLDWHCVLNLLEENLYLYLLSMSPFCQFLQTSIKDSDAFLMVK